MTSLVLGNRHAVESRDHGETFQPLPKGKRATVVHLEDDDSLAEQFQIVTHPKGVFASHSTEDAAPAWVASDNLALAALVAAHYGGIEIRHLSDPADHKNQGKALSAKELGPLATLATLTLLTPVLAFTLLRTHGWLKTNAGNDFQAAQMGGSASATAVGKWVALTANSTTPAVTDTTLTGEITTGGGGLVRKAGTYAHTTSASSYTITTVFTANGSDSLPVTIAKRGIFDASSGGNLIFTTLVSPTATFSASGDQMTETTTVSM